MRRLWGVLVVVLLVAGCTSRVGGDAGGPSSKAPDGPIQLAVPIELARVTTSAPPSTVLTPVPSGTGVSESDLPTSGVATTTTAVPPTSEAPTTSVSPTAVVTTTAPPSGPRVLPDPDGVQLTLEEPFLVITSLDHADVRQEQTTWSVTITLSNADGTVFSDWTETHVGEQVAMVADDEVISAPSIQAPIPGREISISAQYTRDEAEDLLARITGR